MAYIDNLVAYYKCDETSGDFLDAHASLTFTDHNGTGSATGVLNTARDFEKDSSQYASRADDANFSCADIDFDWSGWFKLESKSANMFIVGKSADVSSDATIAQLLSYNLASDRFRFTVGNGSTSQAVLANNFGSPSTGVWCFIRWWHDSVANTVNIQVNNGTADSQSYSGGSYDDTGHIAFGTSYSGGSPFGLYYDGLMDEVSFFKRIRTGADMTYAYGGGTPPAYPFGGPENLKTLNGLAKASIKTTNGLAIANVKTWNGVA